MTTGFGALQKHLKEAAEKAASMGTGRLGFFKLAANERKIIRFLTDDIKTLPFATRVTGVDGKKYSFAVPDPTNNLVARYAKEGAYDDSHLKVQTIGVAVLRKEVVIPPADPTQRPQVRYEDLITKRDDGTSERTFFVVQQSHGNFWDKIQGFYDVYHTITDRDYSITRIGSDLQTDYQIAPLDCPADDPLRDPEVLKQHYGYGKAWDKDDPNRFWWCPQTLDEFVAEHSSERRIKRFLLGEGLQQDGASSLSAPGPASPAGTASTPPPQAPTQPSADFQDLRARLSSAPPPPVGSGPPPIDPTGINDQGEPPF
jgi:hypothetical protein